METINFAVEKEETYTQEMKVRGYVFKKQPRTTGHPEIWDVFKGESKKGYVKMEGGKLRAFSNTGKDKGVCYNPDGVNVFNRPWDREFFFRDLTAVF